MQHLENEGLYIKLFIERVSLWIEIADFAKVMHELFFDQKKKIGPSDDVYCVTTTKGYYLTNISAVVQKECHYSHNFVQIFIVDIKLDQ